jgi:hypothetical protein
MIETQSTGLPTPHDVQQQREHHRILIFVGRMMSAIGGNGNSAGPVKTPRFRCAKPLFRSASGRRRNVLVRARLLVSFATEHGRESSAVNSVRKKQAKLPASAATNSPSLIYIKKLNN